MTFGTKEMKYKHRLGVKQTSYQDKSNENEMLNLIEIKQTIYLHHSKSN